MKFGLLPFSTLLRSFSPSDRCCGALICPCTESYSRFSTPPPCQVVVGHHACFSSQFIFRFIPSRSGMAKAVDPRKSLKLVAVYCCMLVNPLILHRMRYKLIVSNISRTHKQKFTLRLKSPSQIRQIIFFQIDSL